MPQAMNVLIVGNGAREHALAWKLSSSSRKPRILTAPGNAGTAQLGENFDIPAEDVEGLVQLAKDESVDLTIVGPEAPLAAGVVDRFKEERLRVFGPTKAAARIESSKSFAKSVMADSNTPTAEAVAFRDMGSAIEYVKFTQPPFVVKADGLAAGKGVVMSPTREEAVAALNSIMLNRDFGDAGDTVLIERWLRGQEVSVFAFVDGTYVSEMTAACDYKRVGVGDTGPNTGGMGSYSPPPFWNEDLDAKVRSEIMQPVVARLNEMGCPFQGILYAGLMITEDGPTVIEFNCRMGDPEAQVVIPRLKTDLLELALSASEGRLSEQRVEWSDESWVGVTLASEGYPGQYETGFEISGIPENSEECVIFHAGTRLYEVLETNQNGKIVSSGGRVLTVASRGEKIAEARKSAYEVAERIRFDNVYYRRDIAANI